MHTAPPTNEQDFARDARAFYRRAGDAEAQRLVTAMQDAIDDGAGRHDLHMLVRDALAALPTLN